jgi:outer membrane protein assembly factor BamB
MNCEEVQSQMELYVLGDPAAGVSDIRMHLADCPACSTLQKEYRLLVARLAPSASAPRSGVDFSAAVVRAVEQEIGAATRPLMRRPGLLKIGALAACLLTGLGLWPFWPERIADTGHHRPASYTIPARAMSVPTSEADHIVVRDRDMYLLRENDGRTHLVALNTETGSQIWDSHVESYGYLALGDTRLCCLAPHDSGSLDLVVVDVGDGRTLWRHTQERPRLFNGLSTPVFLPNGSICWTVGSTIQVLRSTDGAVLWSQVIPEEPLLSAAVGDDGDLYVAGTKRLYKMDTASGERRWQTDYGFAVSRWVRPLLAAGEDQFCVALRMRTGPSVLMCVHATDRKIMWTHTLPPISHLCMSRERIFIRSQSIRALDLASGALLWQVASTGCSPITHTDGRVWFADAGNRGGVFALNAASGAKVSALSGLRSCNALVDTENRAFVKTHDGAVHVISLGAEGLDFGNPLPGRTGRLPRNRSL